MGLKLKDTKVKDFERVIKISDEATGLNGIIAIHNTNLGPGLGGTRFWSYETSAEMLKDAKKLAEGMTLKNSAAGLNFGGGKAVINANGINKTPDLYRSYGEAVEKLNGMYVTAGDVGTTVEDLKCAAENTKYIGGLITDSAPPTAFGVFHAIRAACVRLFGSDRMGNLSVAICGVGKVGSRLAEHLDHSGVELFVTDLHEDSISNLLGLGLDFEAVEPYEIHKVGCDIFSPCALGNVINTNSRSELRCKAIVGAANNQLGSSKDAQWLKDNGILYVPDFIANAGGVIAIAYELMEKPAYEATFMVSKIYDRVLQVLELAEKENKTTHDMAVILAYQRIYQRQII